jgi:hypothetical protein
MERQHIHAVPCHATVPKPSGALLPLEPKGDDEAGRHE